jgi:hypothetical protein
VPPRCRIADAASTIGSALAAGWKRTFHFWAHMSGPAGLRPMELGYTPKTTPNRVEASLRLQFRHSEQHRHVGLAPLRKLLFLMARERATRTCQETALHQSMER